MKNYNREDKPATLSPMQKPTENHTRSSMITPSCFAVVVILFFFSFCHFTLVAEETGDIKSLSGFNLATASASSPARETRPGNVFSSSSFNRNNSQPHITQKTPLNIWALLSLAAAIGGMMLCFRKERWEVLTGIAIVGLVSLIVLQFDIKNKYEEYIDGGLLPLRTRVSFQWAYWVAMIAFILAGANSYLYGRQKSRKETFHAQLMPTPLHVNIITQHANSKEN